MKRNSVEKSASKGNVHYLHFAFCCWELRPSKEDFDITQQLKAAGETLGIKLLDHIIFNQKEYYSFLEKWIL